MSISGKSVVSFKSGSDVGSSDNVTLRNKCFSNDEDEE